MRISTISSFLAALFVLAACGNTTEEQAATGALGGAVVAGPAGALVGGATGAVAGEEIQDAVD